MAVEIEGVGQEVLQAIGAVGVAIVAAVWLLLRPKPTPRILASEAARIAAARASQQPHSGASATAGGSSGEGVGAGAGAGAGVGVGVGADTADTTTQNVRHRGDRGESSSTSQGTSNDTPAAQPAPPAAPTSQSCPICLESPPSCMVQTSCGHLFCTDCVLHYWDATFRPSALVCPCCRGKVPQTCTTVTHRPHACSSSLGTTKRLRVVLCLSQVTLLLRRFGEQEAGAVAAASRIDDYNLLFSNSLRSVSDV